MAFSKVRAMVLVVFLVSAYLPAGAAGAVAATLLGASTLVGLDGSCSFSAVFIPRNRSLPQPEGRRFSE